MHETQPVSYTNIRRLHHLTGEMIPGYSCFSVLQATENWVRSRYEATRGTNSAMGFSLSTFQSEIWYIHVDQT